MSDAGFEIDGVRDPRLAVHATSATPAWLWSPDGAHILWANAAGTRLFGERSAARLAERTIGPADPHRRHAVQLASRLPPGVTRLEKLRGFGAPFGRLVTCACTLLSFRSGASALLIAAVEPVGRTIPLTERLAHVTDSVALPAMMFTVDGALIGANDAAKPFAGLFNDLTGHDFNEARGNALRDGHSMLQAEFGRIALHRVGTGAETALVALIDAAVTPRQAARPSPVVPIVPAPAIEPEQPPEATPPQDAADATPAETTQPEPVPVAPDDATPYDATSAPALDPGSISATLAQMDGLLLSARRHPLRFMWQMDDDGRFVLGSDEFTRLIGSRTAAAFGRLWSDMSDALGLDPEGRVAAAIATRGTWSGIVVNWPADGSGARLPVELSGLPVYDRSGRFLGYRGFGVCRDLDGMARLAAQRRDDVLYSSLPAIAAAPPAPQEPPPRHTTQAAVSTPPDTEPVTVDIEDLSPNQQPQAIVDTSPNVVPFPSATEPKLPSLTAGESNAFDELARRLSARLEGAPDTVAPDATAPDTDVAPAISPEADTPVPEIEPPPEMTTAYPAAVLQPERSTPRASSRQDPQLLDHLPGGVLVYRDDRLLYANSAFLACTGYDSLHALNEAGGLDALMVEPGASSAGNPSDAGTAVVMAATSQHGPDKGEPAEARLLAISWDGEPAQALVLSGPRAPAAAPAPVAADSDTTRAEELSTILDTTSDGIVIVDDEGRLLSCNHGAETLFGRGDSEITMLRLIDLIAPDSQRTALDYFEAVRSAPVASLLEHGREVLGRTRDGGAIPLSLTIGRTGYDTGRLFAIFRNQSQTRKTESDLTQARRQADRVTQAKADILGRISHEVRMPLNAIIGFADVMIAERFGPLGNERYADYMKDIRASGERVIAIIDDLLNLSRIESGKMEMSLTNQDLNSMVEQCVAVMQPHANRERIIIRTSLAHALPAVKADARALRQIALNLIGNSIHLANAGGQVIVSTATTDFGDIVLRVRDTGPGLNDNEIAAAMEPFRAGGAPDQTADSSATSLSLTKALVEANRAKFHIKTAPHSGTLIEVLFSHASAIA
jgi:PAS domain S-box-containing protein